MEGEQLGQLEEEERLAQLGRLVCLDLLGRLGLPVGPVLLEVVVIMELLGAMDQLGLPVRVVLLGRKELE